MSQAVAYQGYTLLLTAVYGCTKWAALQFSEGPCTLKAVSIALDCFT